MGKKSICLFKNMLDFGGAEKQLILLANNLARTDFDVHIITNHINNKLISDLDKSIDVVKLPNTNLIGQIIFLRRLLTKRRIHICHCWDFRSSIIGIGGTLLKKTRIIDGSIRSAPSKDFKFFKVYKFKYLIFRLLRIYLVSNSKRGLEAYNLEAYSNSYVIYNAFEPKPTTRLEKRSPKNIRVGMVANMRWKKDYQTFIKAGLVCLKNRRDIDFFLIGDGPDKEKHVAFIQEGSMKKYFHFTGFLTNVEETVKTLDICVLANNLSGEGLSNSIMEYMFYAKPVIATNLGGNIELVDDGTTGFLVQEYDYLKIANKIIFLIENPDISRKMGEAGKKKIESQFSTDKMLSEYISIYNVLCAG